MNCSDSVSVPQLACPFPALVTPTQLVVEGRGGRVGEGGDGGGGVCVCMGWGVHER